MESQGVVMDSNRPYVPFYKPYGMSDEEYQYELKLAQEKLEEWEAEQDRLRQERDEEIKSNDNP